MEVYRARLEQLAGPRAFYHCGCVEREARRLAQRYGADEEKAALAGLLHDICKDMEKDAQLQIIRKSAIILQSGEQANPSIWHGIAASAFLREELGVTDPEVLSAVRYHTTGRACMTSLEKIVYLADCVSQDRAYPGLTEMRQAVDRSLDEGMLLNLKHTLTMLVNSGKPIVYDTYAAYNFYLGV